MHKIFNRHSFFQKTFSVLLTVALIVGHTCLGHAQTIAINAHPVSSTTDALLLQGLKVYPQSPFHFDFLIERQKEPHPEPINRLIKYFLSALTTPEKDLWVNLSPYEKDRIAEESFAKTEMGRDLLEQDYILKQKTSSLMNPQEEVGKVFWQEVYQKAQEEFGTTDIPIDAFHKVWIVPDRAVVYENSQTQAIYIVDSHLKVMLEADYLAQLKNAELNRVEFIENSLTGDPDSQSITKDVMQDIIIPLLEQEVNEGASFQVLRQIYHSLILATWYKNKMKKSILSSVYVNQRKIQGVRTDDAISFLEENREAQEIWEAYVHLFQKGVYDFIQEENIEGQSIPKQYTSGGKNFTNVSKHLIVKREILDFTDKPDPKKRELNRVEVLLNFLLDRSDDDLLDSEEERILNTAEWIKTEGQKPLTPQQEHIVRFFESSSEERGLLTDTLEDPYKKPLLKFINEEAGQPLTEGIVFDRFKEVSALQKIVGEEARRFLQDIQFLQFEHPTFPFTFMGLSNFARDGSEPIIFFKQTEDFMPFLDLTHILVVNTSHQSEAYVTEFFFVNRVYVGYGLTEVTTQSWDELQMLFHMFEKTSHPRINRKNIPGLSKNIFEARLKLWQDILPADTSAHITIEKHQYQKIEIPSFYIRDIETVKFKPIELLPGEEQTYDHGLVGVLQSSTTKESQNTGGIDFTSQTIEIETLSDGGSVLWFQIPPKEMLESIVGVSPQIINILPVESVNIFLSQ